MQDLRRIALVLLVLAASLLAPPSRADVPLRVMTWNLRWFPGGAPGASPDERARQLREVATVIARVDPDVLLLQEVRGLSDVEELLAAAGGKLSVQVVSRFRDANGALSLQQLAACSRAPATAAWSAPWERGWAGAPRGYAHARLDVGGTIVHVYTLHLKSNLGRDPVLNASKREDAVEQVLAHLERMRAETGSPHAILAGDFNVSPEIDGRAVVGERTLTLPIEHGFFWPFEGVPAADRVTIRGSKGLPDACFDHVFVRGLGRPVARVLSDARGSDHLPVVVDLVVPAAAGGTARSDAAARDARAPERAAP